MRELVESRSVLEDYSMRVSKDLQEKYLLECYKGDHYSSYCRYSLQDLIVFRDNLTMLIEHELKEGK